MLGVVLVFCIMGVYTILLIIKERKIPFNFKNGVYCSVIFVLLLMLLQPLMINQIFLRLTAGTELLSSETVNEGQGFFSSAFTWYNLPSGTRGVPDFYFSFKNIYYGYWMLPFLFIGIAYLLFNRKNNDLLIISTLITFYIVTHLNLIGIILGARSPRLYYFESIMLYPIIAIGVTKITYFFTFKNKEIVKYLVVIGFILSFLFFSFKPTYSFFNQSYDGIGRLNSFEMSGATWINEKIPKNNYMMLVGAPTFKQQSWLQAMIPERVIVFDQDALAPSKDRDLNKVTYVIFDYSFLYMLNQQAIIDNLKAYEQNITRQENLLYNDKEMFKVYKLV